MSLILPSDDYSSPCWSSDGRHIYIAQVTSYLTPIYRYDVESNIGEIFRVLDQGLEVWRQLDCTRQGDRLLVSTTPHYSILDGIDLPVPDPHYGDAGACWSGNDAEALVGYWTNNDGLGALRIHDAQSGVITRSITQNMGIGYDFVLDWSAADSALILMAPNLADLRFLHLDGGPTPPGGYLAYPQFLGRGEAVGGFLSGGSGRSDLALRPLDGGAPVVLVRDIHGRDIAASPVAAKIAYLEYVMAPGHDWPEIRTVGAAPPDLNEGEILLPFIELIAFAGDPRITIDAAHGTAEAFFRTDSGAPWSDASLLDALPEGTRRIQFKLRLTRALQDDAAAIRTFTLEFRGELDSPAIVGGTGPPPISTGVTLTPFTTTTSASVTTDQSADWIVLAGPLSSEKTKSVMPRLHPPPPGRRFRDPITIMQWLPREGEGFRILMAPESVVLPPDLVPKEKELLMRRRGARGDWIATPVSVTETGVASALLRPGLYAVFVPVPPAGGDPSTAGLPAGRVTVRFAAEAAETRQVRIAPVEEAAAADAPAPSGIRVGAIHDIRIVENGVALDHAEFDSPVAVSIAYDDADDDGFVDGTDLRAATLRMLAFSMRRNEWTPLPTTVDAGQKIATGLTRHFSLFTLVGGGTAANLAGLRVTPNPFRPNDGNPATGRAYDGTAGSGVYFLNLPRQVRIEVYTITGAKVTTFSTTNSTGQIQWDARNEDRRDAASGHYFYIVTDLATGERQTGRLAVIR
jgi:hypothetical protein